MDTDTPEQPAKPKRANYKSVLDAPLSNVKRKIAIGLAIADNTKEVARIAGTSEGYAYREGQNELVGSPAGAAVMAKRKILDGLIVVLDDIISREAESALKYSDKLKAIELKAQLTGVLDTAKGETTNNTLVLDLRHATESELLQELAQLEEHKRNVIDVQAQGAA